MVNGEFRLNTLNCSSPSVSAGGDFFVIGCRAAIKRLLRRPLVRPGNAIPMPLVVETFGRLAVT